MKRTPFAPSAAWKGVFAGAGSDGLNEMPIAQKIVDLTGKEPSQVKVAYLGTATYDLPKPMERQTGLLAQMGCTIRSVLISDATRAVDPVADIEKPLGEADVVLVSGGNTLYAMDLWKHFNIDKMLADARDRGAVLCGGSAGAICWFDGGHSDSADPDTFKQAMEAAAAAASSSTENKDEASGAPAAGEAAKPWKYIRVSCLGLYPGLVCPHHDKVQSNGVLRMHDFREMMARHPGERALCIDHWAALVVDGEQFSVLSLPGKPGTLLPSGELSESDEGIPWVWMKTISGEHPSNYECKPFPQECPIVDYVAAADSIAVDPREDEVRGMNPSPWK